MKSASFRRAGSLVPMGWDGEHPPVGLGHADFSKSSCSLFLPR